MEKITSRNNPKIKYACSLKKSAARNEEKLLLAEGLRLCRDAAENGVNIEQCFLTEQLASSPECENIINVSKHTYIIDGHIAEKLADTKNPQGIFCVCEMPKAQEKIAFEGKYIFLENLRDPGNLGTVIRTAEAFGLSGAVLFGCCDAYSPKVLRASMGAVFRFPLIEVSDETEFINSALQGGMELFCAVVNPDAEDVKVLEGKKGVITAVGNEANGLCENILSFGRNITVHMAGRAESFNASQAATILMYEMSK